MEAVRRAMAELADDLMLRVALVAAAPDDKGQGAGARTSPGG
jgi:hypothetical protein